MESVRIDRTDLWVSRLGFGTATLHHRILPSTRQDLIATAFDGGITHFDTSPYYGYGLAELDLGRFMKTHRDTITVASKIGLYPPTSHVSTIGMWGRKALGKISASFTKPVVDWTIQRADASLRQSLRRLRSDYVDILFLHEPDSALIQADEILFWLEKLCTEGTIHHWGVAGNPASYAEWINGDHPLAQIVQAKDSLGKKEADVALKQPRPLQFTYGYLSEYTGRSVSVRDQLNGALLRNQAGCVLVSSRKKERIREFARVLA